MRALVPLLATTAACSGTPSLSTNPDAVEWDRYSDVGFVVRGCDDVERRAVFGRVVLDLEGRATLRGVAGLQKSAPLDFAIDGEIATSTHANVGSWSDALVVLSKAEPHEFLLRVFTSDQALLCQANLYDERTYVADGGPR